MNNKIRFDHDAVSFEEALPIGNGAFGAMVWGGKYYSKLSLNADTFWTGTVGSDAVNDNRAEKIKKHRELIEQRRFIEAEKQAFEELDSPRQSELYIPVGDIVMERMGKGEIVSSYRELDLESATVFERYKYVYDDVSYQTRRTYISKKYDVLISELQSNRNMHFVVCFHNHLKKEITEYSDGIGVLISAPGSLDGAPVFDCKDTITLGLVLKVKTDGDLDVNNGEIFIKNAKQITLYVALETNFVDYKTVPDKDKELCGISCDKINRALILGADAVYKTHVTEHQNLYNRMKLSLPGNKKEDFYAEYERNNPSNQLIELMFNYGRYLLISSSSKGTQPANLQGIWNDNFAPPWSCGYTSNINLQMNYWLAEPANLSECHQPLMTMIQELSEAGKVAAKEYYNCDGWVAHHNIDLWRKCGPAQGEPQHSLWPMGSGWLCQHLWTHYIYNMDEVFLKNTAYPITKEAVKFYLDFLYEDEDGYLVTIPSVSPENGYDIDGNRVSVTKMSAMDRCIITELFENLVQMSELLGNDDLVPETKSALSKLSPFKFGSQGQLLEWNEEFKECEPGHRHLSHLYGVYPGNVIIRDKELGKAARKSLDARIENGSAQSGWSSSWVVHMLATYCDAENSKKHIDGILKNHTYPNLLDVHPPFQIDGNFGFTSAVLHMLVQSEFDIDLTTIKILPACPAEWESGKICGVCVKGGIKVDVEWNSKQASVKLYAQSKRKIKLLCRNKEITDAVCGEKQIVLC